jgi:hypothetical protein
VNLEICNAITSKLIDEWEKVSKANNVYVVEHRMKVTLVIAHLNFANMHCIHFSSRDEGMQVAPSVSSAF